MADISKEKGEVEEAKAAMARTGSLTQEMQLAFGGMSGLLLALLQELREIKEKLPDA